MSKELINMFNYLALKHFITFFLTSQKMIDAYCGHMNNKIFIFVHCKS